MRFCPIHPDVAVYCCEQTECRECSNRWRRRVRQGDIPNGLQSRFYDFDIDMEIEEARIAHDKAKNQFDTATTKREQELALQAMQKAEEKKKKAIDTAFARQREGIERERQQEIERQEEERRHRAWISHHSSEAEIKDRLHKLGVVFPEDR